MKINQFKLIEDGELRGIFTAEEIEEKIGLKKHLVSRYCCTEAKYKKRYLIETAPPKLVMTESDLDFAKRWREMQRLFGIEGV